MKKLLFLVFIALAGIFSVSTIIAQSSAPDFSNATVIIGEIGPESLATANTIYAWAQTSDTIDIVINSPGGDVILGSAIVSAIDAATNKGVNIRCVVPFLAASMAMHIFAHCTERYIMRGAFLLYHEAYIMAMFVKITPSTAAHLKMQLEILTKRLEEYLVVQLGIPKLQFEANNRNEVMWPAEAFALAHPKFTMKIIDDVVLPENVLPYNISK